MSEMSVYKHVSMDAYIITLNNTFMIIKPEDVLRDGTATWSMPTLKDTHEHVHSFSTIRVGEKFKGLLLLDSAPGGTILKTEDGLLLKRLHSGSPNWVDVETLVNTSTDEMVEVIRVGEKK